MQESTGTNSVIPRVGDFHEVVKGIQSTFTAGQTTTLSHELFRVGKVELFDIYLNAFAPEHRQEFNCACCRSFLNRYGSLVQVNEDGAIKSAIWNENDHVDDFWKGPVKALREAVEGKKRVATFALLTESTIGRPELGGFNHFAVKTDQKFNHDSKNKGKYIGERQQRFARTIKELSTISAAVLDKTKIYLEQGKFNQGTKFLRPVQWWIYLKQTFDAAPNQDARANLVWRITASAPDGWANMGTAHGKLISDVAAGDSIEVAAHKHNAVTHTLVYQQATTPASDGNIRRAEQLVEELGLASALERRHATAQELTKIWEPKPVEDKPKEGGAVFGHMLKTPDATAKSELVQANTLWESELITFKRFQETVLGTATKIEVYLDSGNQNFIGFMTATDPEAKPLVRWDSEEKRNPVSWFVFDGGSRPESWGLKPGFVEVVGITPKPYMVDNEADKDGLYFGMSEAYSFLINGCAPVDQMSMCLFPAILRGDLHEIRDTIWNFSRTAHPEKPVPGSTTGGLLFGHNTVEPTVVRVTTDTFVKHYKIDRWI